MAQSLVVSRKRLNWHPPGYAYSLGSRTAQRLGAAFSVATPFVTRKSPYTTGCRIYVDYSSGTSNVSGILSEGGRCLFMVNDKYSECVTPRTARLDNPPYVVTRDGIMAYSFTRFSSTTGQLEGPSQYFIYNPTRITIDVDSIDIAAVRQARGWHGIGHECDLSTLFATGTGRETTESFNCIVIKVGESNNGVYTHSKPLLLDSTHMPFLMGMLPLGGRALLFRMDHSPRVSPGIYIYGFAVHIIVNTDWWLERPFLEVGFLRRDSTMAGRLSSGTINLMGSGGDANGHVADVKIDNGELYISDEPRPKLRIIIGNHHASTNSYYIAVWSMDIPKWPLQASATASAGDVLLPWHRLWTVATLAGGTYVFQPYLLKLYDTSFQDGIPYIYYPSVLDPHPGELHVVLASPWLGGSRSWQIILKKSRINLLTLTVTDDIDFTAAASGFNDGYYVVSPSFGPNGTAVFAQIKVAADGAIMQSQGRYGRYSTSGFVFSDSPIAPQVKSWASWV